MSKAETAPKVISLAALDATQASAQPYEFEYITEAGVASGVFFSVLGGESAAVQEVTAKLQNERRRKHAAREIAARIGTGAKTPEFETFESDVEYGKRMAAARLVGWRGIAEPFTPENALKLCMSNSHISSQITAASEATGNFIKL